MIKNTQFRKKALKKHNMDKKNEFFNIQYNIQNKLFRQVMKLSSDLKKS